MGLGGLTVYSSVLTIYNYLWSTFYFDGKTSHLTTWSIKHLLKTTHMIYSLAYNMATPSSQRGSQIDPSHLLQPYPGWKADGVETQASAF